jgi:hypothetical protein
MGGQALLMDAVRSALGAQHAVTMEVMMELIADGSGATLHTTSA